MNTTLRVSIAEYSVVTLWFTDFHYNGITNLHMFDAHRFYEKNLISLNENNNDIIIIDNL